MALNSGQLAILKTELDTDPVALGYTTDDPDCADLLNEVRSGASYQIPNVSASVSDVLDAIDGSELSALDINGFQFFLFRMTLANGSVDISAGSPIIGQVADIFTVADAPNSRTALNALVTRDASRAEILFDFGVVITHLDVGKARLV
jgi:hypothetical protein